MHQVCQQHQNRIERICLHPCCPSRALCLLCDHPHGSPFRSIMAKQSQSYKKFEAGINLALDRYLLHREHSPEEQLREQQQRLVRKYFADLKQQVEHLLAREQEEVVGRLTATEHAHFLALRQARLDKNYVTVKEDLFSILLQVYEGAELAEIFRANERGNAEEAYRAMQGLHDTLTALMEARRHSHKLRLPDIRTLALEGRTKPMDAWTNYDAENEGAPKKWTVSLACQSTCEFDSIISDCIPMGNSLLTASYDKKLRLFDRSLTLRGEAEYPNILTKLQQIGQDIYAIGMSKELLIEKILPGGKGKTGVQGQPLMRLQRQPLMRLAGHSERISDLHALNTRIIASGSTQGVKVWDLYHQRCEYTLNAEASPSAIRFLGGNGGIAVGYNSHQLRVYSTETMRASKKYALPGVATVIDQGKCPESTFYVGSFPKDLLLMDLRMATPAANFALPQDAPTVLVDSVNDPSLLAVGDRGGTVSLLDLRTRKVRVSWGAHGVKTHLMRPRGVVAVMEEADEAWITVGCNDRKLKQWSVSKAE